MVTTTVLATALLPAWAHGGGGGGGGHGGGGGGHSFGGGGHSFSGGSFSSHSFSSFSSGSHYFNHSFSSPSSSHSFGAFSHPSVSGASEHNFAGAAGEHAFGGEHATSVVGNEHASGPENNHSLGSQAQESHMGNPNNVSVSMPAKSPGFFGHIHRMFGGNSSKQMSNPELSRMTTNNNVVEPGKNEAFSTAHQQLFGQQTQLNQGVPALHGIAAGTIPHAIPAISPIVSSRLAPMANMNQFANQAAMANANAFLRQRMQLAALGAQANQFPWSTGVFNSLHSGYGGFGSGFGGFGSGFVCYVP